MRHLLSFWRRFWSSAIDASGLPDCGTDAGWSDRA